MFPSISKPPFFLIAALLVFHHNPVAFGKVGKSAKVGKSWGKSSKSGKSWKQYANAADKGSDETLQALSETDFIIGFGEEMLRHSANVRGNMTVEATLYETELDFIFSKASVTWFNDTLGGDSISEGATAFIEMFGQDPIDFGDFNQNSPTYAIKTKKQEALILETDTGTANVLNYNGYPGNLRDLNMIIMDRVLNEIVTKKQREEYEKRGRKLEFLPDFYIPIPPVWVASKIIVTHDDADDVTYISSPFTLSPSGPPTPPRFQGAFYGKPITPAQVYEWIVYDAFK